MPTATEPKHTKGPWQLNAGHERPGNGPALDVYFITAEKPMRGELPIAEIRTGKNEVEDRGPHFLANAKLMTASPDLLDALQAMQAAFTTYSNEFNPGNKIKAVCDWGVVNDALIAASKAVRKATIG